MRFKSRSLVLMVLLLLMNLTGIAENSETFYCSFDKGLNADKASGQDTATINPKADAETEKLLMDGIDGKGLLIGQNEDKSKAYSYTYDADKNISKEEGSVSFWIKPLDWSGKDPIYHVMFQADHLQVYKHPTVANHLFFIIGSESVKASIKNWEPGEWHFVACSWDKTEFKLYVDGRLDEIGYIKPIAGNLKTIRLGTRALPAEKGKSIIDDVRIYNYAISQKALTDEYARHSSKISYKSLVNIKTGKQTPVIDGVVQEGEYSFGGAGFFNTSGTYSFLQSRYFISYDDDNLYVAIISPAPGNKLKTEQAERDGQLWNDDSVEVFLMPENEKKDYFQFIFNSKGIFYDGKKVKPAWNIGNLKSESKVDNDKWTIEMAIPFKELGGAVPENNSSWKINICRSFQPDAYTSISPVRRGYGDFANFAKLTFAAETPDVNLKSIGALVAGKVDFDMSITAHKAERITCSLLCELDGKRIFLQDKQFDLSPGKTETYKVARDVPAKRSLLEINLKTDSSGELYSSSIIFSNDSTLDVSFIYTDIENQTLYAVAKTTKSSDDREEYVLLQMMDGASKPALEAKYPVKDGSSLSVIPFDISKLNAGLYKLLIRHIDGKGNITGDFWQDFSKPSKPAAWDNNSAGISDKVLPPWTPLIARDSKVSCWGRTYAFNDSIMFSSIMSQGKEMLAGPARISVNGKIRDAKDKTETKFIERKDAVVLLQNKVTQENISVTSDIRVEFDGFMWFDVEIAPANGGEVNIDALSIDIPLKPEFATLVHNSKKDSLNDPFGRTGAIKKDTWHKNLFELPVFWVGNEEGGLNWVASDLKGWYVKNKDRSVEIIPGEKETIVRLNVIDTPVKLSSKRKIAFGIQVTPVRPPDPALRKLNRVPRNWMMWTGPWLQYFNYTDPKFLDYDAIKSLHDRVKANTIKRVFYYFGLCITSPYSPEWGYWSTHWTRKPAGIGKDATTQSMKNPHRDTYTTACLDCESFRNFHVWKFADMLNNDREVGISDFYFDGSEGAASCENQAHGCAWLDDYGKKSYNSFAVLGSRDTAKRLRNIIKSKNPDSLICFHLTCQRASSAFSFADVIADGEEFFEEVAAKESYYDVFNPEMFRARYVSSAWGPQVLMISEFAGSLYCLRPDRIRTWKPTDPESVRAIRHFLGYMMLHDTSIWAQYEDILGETQKLWDIQDRFGWDEKVKFVPYWDKSNPVVIVKPMSDRLMLSTYLREGKALVVVLNDTDKKEDITIKIADVGKINAAKNETLKATDAYDRSVKYEIQNNELNLTLSPRELKIFILEPGSKDLVSR